MGFVGKIFQNLRNFKTMKIKIFHIASSIKFIGLFVGWSINISKNRGWGKIEIKDHLSSAEAKIGAELSKENTSEC